MDLGMEAMVKTKVVSLLKNANLEAAKGDEMGIYQAVEKVVRWVIARGAVNEAIYMKVESLYKLQDFLQHLSSNLIKILLFTVPINHLVRQSAQVAVTDEARFYD